MEKTFWSFACLIFYFDRKRENKINKNKKKPESQGVRQVELKELIVYNNLWKC